MQKIKWKKNKVLFIFLLMLFIFFVRAMLMPIQFSSVALVNAIGIDKSSEGYLVSVQIITPKYETGVTKNIEVHSSSDETVYKCFKNLSINLGKELGFAHLNAVVISSELLLEEELNNILNPIIISRKENKNTPLITTNNLAKQILNTSQNEGSIYDIAQFFSTQKGKNALIKQVSNNENNQKTLLLPIVGLEEDEAQAEKLGEQDNETQTTSNKKLKFNGDMLFLKNKEEQVVLTSEDYENLLLFEKAQRITLATKEQLGEDVTILLSKTKIKTNFYRGVPRLHLNLTLEVSGLEGQVLGYDKEQFKKIIIEKTRQKLAQAFFLIKEYNMNLFLINERFYAFNNKDWKEYTEQIENENYFQKLELFAQFEVKVKNQISLA